MQLFVSDCCAMLFTLNSKSYSDITVSKHVEMCTIANTYVLKIMNLCAFLGFYSFYIHLLVNGWSVSYIPGSRFSTNITFMKCLLVASINIYYWCDVGWESQ